MDDEELLFWSKINSAVASFCLETTLNHYKNSTNKMAVALVGEELEWCGSQAYLFMAKSFLGTSTQSLAHSFAHSLTLGRPRRSLTVVTK
jgi:hypothetical protein